MKLWWPRSATICPLQAGEPGNIIQYMSKGQRTRNVNSWGQEQMEVPAQAKRKSIHPSSIFFFFFFALFILSAYRCLSTLGGWISILSLLNQMFISSKAQTNPEIMFYQQSGHHLGQSIWHIKLTSTYYFMIMENIFTFWLYSKILLLWMDWEINRKFYFIVIVDKLNLQL